MGHDPRHVAAQLLASAAPVQLLRASVLPDSAARASHAVMKVALADESAATTTTIIAEHNC